MHLCTVLYYLLLFVICLYVVYPQSSVGLLELNKLEPGHEKMCLMPYANNKGVDKPAHPHSLISALVVRCQDRMIPLVYISEILRF